MDKIDGDERIQNVNYRSYSYVPMAKNVSYQYYKLVIRKANGFSSEDFSNAVNDLLNNGELIADPVKYIKEIQRLQEYYSSKIGMQLSGFDLRGKVSK